MSDMPQDHAQNDHPGVDRGPSTNRSPQKGTPRRNPQVLNEEQCLTALGQITGMMLTGYMNPNEASIAVRVYDTLLKHHRQPKADKVVPRVEPKTIADAVRSNPSVLNSLAAFLSQEQIDEILVEIQGDDSEAV